MPSPVPDREPNRPPSVDSLLRDPQLSPLIDAWGRLAVRNAIRAHQAAQRVAQHFDTESSASLVEQLTRWLLRRGGRGPRPVFNLSGTVLHTNLGRAALPEAAADAVRASAVSAVDLEYRLEDGSRGQRDDHVRALLCDLTGAEDALVVNNNAAALLLLLNTLALNREVPVSRGELIEIGGSFRLPEIMQRSGCVLREVGTTNRTHLPDFAAAINERTGLLMKVHRSNFVVEGFTAEVPEADLAALAHQHNLPFAVDLGSGSLVRLEDYGLPPEPTPAQTLVRGADLVTFSGDKLLGGPQAGIIVGARRWIEELNKNPLKRALRVDKLTLTALAEVLKLLTQPETLPQAIPVLRDLTRPTDDIHAQALRLLPAVQDRLSGHPIEVVELSSQFGSGAMPGHTLVSAGLKIGPAPTRNIQSLSVWFRELPRPVIGRVRDGALVLDLRCLADEAAFRQQLETAPALPT